MILLRKGITGILHFIASIFQIFLLFYQIKEMLPIPT